jgi:L-alanine-DL-glutamate epimerase-like enolase superfamily enzyme
MTTRIRLLSASLHYPPDLVLHTASSGPIAALDELYLVVERDRQFVGFGEIRENIAYLTGLAPAQLRAALLTLLKDLRWEAEPEAIRQQLEAAARMAPAPACALVDTLLCDWVARARGVSVAELFGARFVGAHSTNQTLFLSEDAQFLDHAARYVARGFRKLKVRVGAGAFAADLRRLKLLRERFGDLVEVAIDANGRWPLEDAPRHLDALGDLRLAYVEQPTTADWDSLRRLAERAPMPVMLDESVATSADIDRVVDAGGRLWAHLKIVKLGGITPVIAAARRLAAAGIPFMIGQMNEGAGATAAALHCAIATQPAHAELYGADGLLDDPVSGIVYETGQIRIRRAPGLGVALDTTLLAPVWESAA